MGVPALMLMPLMNSADTFKNAAGPGNVMWGRFQ